MARDYLPDDNGYKLISRLLAIGEVDDALELVFRTYMMNGSGILPLRDSEKMLLTAQMKHNIDKLKKTGQHGQILLLEYLDANQNLLQNGASARPKVLIEIGTTREDIQGQGSTRQIADFCEKHGLHFITVDMDPHNTRMAADKFARMGVPFEAITMKGEDFLRNYTGRLDFIFLDAYDFDHGKHSSLRQSRYKKFLGNPISDAECHQMHLDCAESIAAKLAPDGVVCLDDTWLADDGQWTCKGTLAMPFLLQHGFKVIKAMNRAALLVRDTAHAAS
jgi:hypothetical protein